MKSDSDSVLGEDRKERSKKVGISRPHCVTTDGMAQVKFSKEEERREKGTRGEVHGVYSVCSATKKTDGYRV